MASTSTRVSGRTGATSLPLAQAAATGAQPEGWPTTSRASGSARWTWNASAPEAMGSTTCATSPISVPTVRAPAEYQGRRLPLTQPQWPSSSEPSAATRLAAS
jgi:hypothetical protein